MAATYSEPCSGFDPAAAENMNKLEMLPKEYLERMKKLFGSEYDEFINSYEDEPLKALRFNPLKARKETVSKLVNEWDLKSVPWCPEGYYYGGDIRPGLSPYHSAGVFYIQEPSAMITAEEADIGPEDMVLDLCAAPGGKSTQAAVKAGLLISNEPIPKRARILSSNIERLGLSNVIVTSAYPEELAALMPEAFDRIIVDAPCSGEGMMRKDDTAIAEWSAANVEKCVLRQADILGAAAMMLKPGGKLIYSTCTFEECENEGQIRDFCRKHEEFSLLKSERILPHRDQGEGHFCAVLIKNGKNEEGQSEMSRMPLPELSEIAEKLRRGGIHVLRAGVQMGTAEKDKRGREYYVPSHAEAMAKSFDSDDGNKVNITSMDICLRYLKGESIRCDDADKEGIDMSGAEEGWMTVYYDGYPLGNGKLTGNVIKNHFPKGLRFM